MLKNPKFLGIAKSFIEVYEDLLKKQNSDNGSKDIKNILLSIQIIVNGNLVCELLLKSLISNYPKTHNIKELFYNENMDDNLRGSIINLVIKIMKEQYCADYDINSFEKDLEENKLNFVEWRYLEKSKETDKDTPIKANYQFIDTLLRVLNSLVSSEYKRQQQS